MSETFIIDWPVLAFFGFFFGGHAPKGEMWRSAAFAGGLIATGGFTASAVLSNRHAPDWMWMYYRDPAEMRRVTSWMPVAYISAYLASFAGALRLQRRGSSSVRTAAGAALAAEAAVLAATWDRYHRIGTRQEWEEGRAAELVTLRPQGKAKQISAYLPLVAGSLVAGLVLLQRERRASASSR